MRKAIQFLLLYESAAVEQSASLMTDLTLFIRKRQTDRVKIEIPPPHADPYHALYVTVVVDSIEEVEAALNDVPLFPDPYELQLKRIEGEHAYGINNEELSILIGTRYPNIPLSLIPDPVPVRSSAKGG
jgi:hypothetical protein